LEQSNVDAEQYSNEMAAKVRRLRSVLETVQLRCGYIIGACRGEEEMRLEAKAILALLTES
jgi:hypothetical protein